MFERIPTSTWQTEQGGGVGTGGADTFTESKSSTANVNKVEPL